MAEVTNELIYEVLKKVQEDVGSLRNDVRSIREEMIAMRGHLNAVQRDVANIYDRLAVLDMRVDRIERRLELSDATA